MYRLNFKKARLFSVQNIIFMMRGCEYRIFNFEQILLVPNKRVFQIPVNYVSQTISNLNLSLNPVVCLFFFFFSLVVPLIFELGFPIFLSNILSVVSSQY